MNDRPDDGIATERIELRVPAAMKQELADAARANGLSLADLARMIFRRFLRGRYDEQERHLLEGGD